MPERHVHGAGMSGACTLQERRPTEHRHEGESPVRNLIALSLFASATTAAALIACSSSDEKGRSGSEDQVIATTAVQEGARCSSTNQCQIGLICKERSSGPPPGAVGLPAQPQALPPGAVGMPLPPRTCQKPAPGEEGALCNELV